MPLLIPLCPRSSYSSQLGPSQPLACSCFLLNYFPFSYCSEAVICPFHLAECCSFLFLYINLELSFECRAAAPLLMSIFIVKHVGKLEGLNKCAEEERLNPGIKDKPSKEDQSRQDTQVDRHFCLFLPADLLDFSFLRRVIVARCCDTFLVTHLEAERGDHQSEAS